jgi:L-alanine-DL-glutamate epimerase-like enolase superfamily enzyme
MKITRSEIVPLIMPQKDPNWRFALGGRSRTPAYLIKLMTDDGLTGFGYTNASAAHHGVTPGGIQAALQLYADHLVGQDPFHIEKLLGMLDRVLHGNPGAKSAMDMALYDLQAKALGVPLYMLLGGLVREEVPIMRLLSLKEPAEMAVKAAELVEEGFSYIKVKLSGEAGKDVERTKEIRRAVGDNIHLIVDANQMYLPKIAIEVLKRMKQYGVENCEQPVRADDWHGLVTVKQATDCLIEAHESVKGLEDVFGLVKDRMVDSINLKVEQLGGLRNAKTAAAVCKLGNVSCRVGATGSQILAAASMHFVASTENVADGCELGEFARISDDPAYGLEINKGRLKVPSGPGIGVSVRC